MYRPNNWKNPYNENISLFEKACNGSFEAGADAMLEGLKREAEWVINPSGTVTPEVKHKGGYLVFIPEEE